MELFINPFVNLAAQLIVALSVPPGGGAKVHEEFYNWTI